VPEAAAQSPSDTRAVPSAIAKPTVTAFSLGADSVTTKWNGIAVPTPPSTRDNWGRVKSLRLNLLPRPGSTPRARWYPAGEGQRRPLKKSGMRAATCF